MFMFGIVIADFYDWKQHSSSLLSHLTFSATAGGSVDFGLVRQINLAAAFTLHKAIAAIIKFVPATRAKLFHRPISSLTNSANNSSGASPDPSQDLQSSTSFIPSFLHIN
jgi:hypothetical protein